MHWLYSMEHSTLEQHSLSSSVMLTVALSGDPLVTPLSAAAAGISRSRKNSSVDSTTSLLMMPKGALTIFTPAGKVTVNLESLKSDPAEG